MSKILCFHIMLCRNNTVVNRNVQFKYIRGFSSLPGGDSTDCKFSASYQPVADFYAGKSVFITGGTGFLGKVFLEKLLYSCNELDKIYLLIREKKGVNVNKRIKDMFENPLFTRLKTKNPLLINKVVPIVGDITLPNLGIKPEDEQTLINKVSVVYHAAATVKFNEPLPVAMNINFEGTQKILKLSQRIKNMEALVYVSTAFAHTQKPVLLETIYPPPAKLDDVYRFIEEYGHDMRATMKFIRGKPNTYTFTKSLTEAYIAENHGNIPTIIIRPSIVTPIKDEPVKGWVDNWYGATPLLYNTAMGWQRIILGSGDYITDFIPVDYVSNLSIIAAARANKSNKLQVFNSTTSSKNPLKWGDAYKYFNQETVSREKNGVPYPTIFLSKSRALVNIATILLQMTPAHIADFWMKMTGQEAKYVKTMSQVIDIRNVLEFFVSNQWIMKAERSRELYTSLSSEDRREFPCDPAQIEWAEYFKDYCKGVFRYLRPRKL